MKKLLISFFLIMLILSVSVSAKTVTATIPDYNFILGNSSIYYQDSEYPLLSYKNVCIDTPRYVANHGKISQRNSLGDILSNRGWDWRRRDCNFYFVF